MGCLLPIRNQLLLQGQGEKLGGEGAVFCQIGGFAQAFGQFFSVLEAAQKIAPVLFQAEHGVAGAAEGYQIFFQQLMIELLQFLSIGAPGGEHARVADEAPAQHHRFELGIFLLKVFPIIEKE